MNARSLAVSTLRWLARTVEGEYRPGPYYLPISGGWLPEGSATNFWQMGENVISGMPGSAVVEACVGAYSQTVAMCPGDHWRSNTKGGRERVTTSALSRILRRPNDYQSISDFMLNATRYLMLEGNAYALALRNDRFEIDELHLMSPRMSRPQVAMTGDVFYRLAGNDVIARRLGDQPNQQLIVPQRDVLHIRLHTKYQYPRPLVGETPLMAALGDMAMSGAITQQQINFYKNEARPSAVLSTDLQLDKDQVQFLRDRWDEQSKGLNQGRTPILTAGLKVSPWAVGGKDAQIADVMKISEQHIAMAFRVPLQVLGMGGTSFHSVEALMQFWIATGLGFVLNHVEESIGFLFALKGQPDEYVEFSTDALLRSAVKDRIEALARGVQGGIYSPNEARNQEGLDDVKFGDEPRVQQQVVPLSAAAAIPAAPPAHGQPPAPPSGGAPAATPKPPPQPANGKSGVNDNNGVISDDIQRETRNILAAAGRIGRRRSS